MLGRLQRYASPGAVTKALIAAQSRIDSGELLPTLAKNAKPEEVTAWRAAHGIPETPDKYDLGKDITFEDDDDKALAAEFFKAAHASNQTPDQVKASLKALKAFQEKSAADMMEADKRKSMEGIDALRAEWGPEYRRNINLVHGMLDGLASQGFKEKLLSGRLADGTPIGSDPEALKTLLSLALINNPTAVVVPNGGVNQMQGLEEEIGKIEKTMKENRKAYNADEKMQERYRQLLAARETVKERKAA